MTLRMDCWRPCRRRRLHPSSCLGRAGGGAAGSPARVRGRRGDPSRAVRRRASIERRAAAAGARASRDREDLAWIDQVRIVNLNAIGHIDDGVVDASSICAVGDPPQAVARLDDDPPVVQGNVGGAARWNGVSVRSVTRPSASSWSARRRYVPGAIGRPAGMRNMPVAPIRPSPIGRLSR